MQSFVKMAKNKKIKILLLVILLFALNGVHSTDNLNVPDLVHITKNSGAGQEGLCIAFGEDAYSAIEWSYPIPENENDLPETDTSYQPNQSSPNDCNFEEDQNCNGLWKLKNWTIPTHTPRNYVPIFDTRWEDFKVYLTTNESKISENRLEIPKNSNIGISVRSGSSVDVLLCEGFNPETYPCYTITIGGSMKNEVYIKKFGVNKNLAEYKSTFPVVSVDEWKIFNLFLSETGQITLKPTSKNISYLDVTDASPLNTLYLLTNSTAPALWKIHKNHFLFTNATQYIPFGPAINATSSTICISMYLMMCEDCSISFYNHKNTSEDVVLEIKSMEEKVSYEWKQIRIVIDHITDDKVQLFVKTESNGANPFWAVDNIRTCTKDEFKVRKLSKGNSTQKIDFSNLSYSCHSLKFPGWRPKQQIIPATNLPIMINSPSTTSMELSWKTSYPQPYIINYKGSDICSRDTISHFKSIDRLKSNGWIVTKPKQNTILIENLVPYTHYSISFIDPVYGINTSLSTNTNPTEKPTKDEVPLITVIPTTNQATISISPRKCNVSYGPIVYGLDVLEKSKPRVLFDENIYIWKNLEAYTNYTLEVLIARTINNINNTDLRINKHYNFITKPDVASKLEFVELYETGENSVSFRYKLPSRPKGQPTLIQVRSCSVLLRECRSSIFNITRCHLWKKLYCVAINELIKGTYYTFKLSIKNNNTNAFGGDVQILQRIIENVPGAPTNLTYNIINCSKETEFCNLNVSWSHPYDQKGVINSFEIYLIHNGPPIIEIKLINNEEYLPIYSHLVRYVPYAKTYNMSIRACNNVHKGAFESKLVKIDHIAEHIDQMPKILQTNESTVVFQIPKLDYRLNSSTVIVIVQQNDNVYSDVPQQLISLAEDSLCLYNRTSWITGVWKVLHDDLTTVIIGNNAKTFIDVLNDTIINKALRPKTEYCINFIIKNLYQNTEHIRVYHKHHVVLPEFGSHSNPAVSNAMSTGSIIGLILLVILVITITVLGVLHYKQRQEQRKRTRSDGEHVYEAMPNEDYSEAYNVVYNAMYDKLNHD